MSALALELSIRSQPTRGGGIPAPVLGTNGFTLKSADDKLIIKDTTTPANEYNGTPGAKLTIVRASTAYYYNVSGVWASGATNTLRLDYDSRLGSLKPGYLIEASRTNIVKWSDDLTNVAWTPTNITAAKNQIGPDGAANSASSITATAANATLLQTITVSAVSRYTSAFVKRLAGTGTVEMTMDNVTWTPITVTASWGRGEIPGQAGVVNPIVGFRIATSGDSIAVWCTQCEGGGTTNAISASSPLPTTTANVTRADDSIKLSGTLFPLSQVAGTLYVKAMMGSETGFGTNGFLQLDDNTVNERVFHERNSAVGDRKCRSGINDTGGQGAATTSTNIYLPLSVYKAALGYAFNDLAVCHGVEPILTFSNTTLPTITQASFGSRAGAVSSILHGWVLEAMYMPTRLSNEQLVALAAP